MLSQRSLPAAVAAVSLASLALALSEPPKISARPIAAGASFDAKALYMEHCAKCHGESGDGKGNEELERPARSFLLGGYSYGNTQKAVTRSVVHGIPGTPMPAFGATLSAEQIAAVADYVIALGPPGTIVEPGASVMSVGDRPMIVQGMMPAYEEGAFREPRSLVIGFPNGTTFQYRTQDARLLTVRQGDFLDRRDWGGRGGTELKPLGTLTWKTNGALKGESEFVDAASGAALSRRVTKSEVKGDAVWIHFDLFDAAGEKLGGGQEIVDFLMVEGVPVPVRAVVGASGTTEIDLRAIESEAVFGLIQDFDVNVEFSTAVTDPLLNVVKAPADGVFCFDPSAVEGLRIYIHANEWSAEIGAAVLESLNKQN